MPRPISILMAAMGHNTHRLSVEWSRIEPEEGIFDPAAIARYREMLTGLRQRGIEPMVTLFHFSSPQWLAGKGGWRNPAVVGHFRRFVRHTAEQLGDLVRLWCTINEPNVYASARLPAGHACARRKEPAPLFPGAEPPAPGPRRRLSRHQGPGRRHPGRPGRQHHRL